MNKSSKTHTKNTIGLFCLISFIFVKLDLSS